MNISFKEFLTEQPLSEETFVFAFGRYSPPTKGHILHFLAIKNFAEKNKYPYMIYVSKTVDKKKNPIPVGEKIAYIKKAIPDLHITSASNAFAVIDSLAETKKFKTLIYFAGSDYFEDSANQQMLERLKAFAQERGMTLISKMSRKREATNEISGTTLRQAAINNDFETFLKASPLNMGQITLEDVQKMFQLTQQNIKPAKKTVEK